MKATFIICPLLLCLILVGFSQATREYEEFSDDQIKGLIATLHRMLQKEEAESLPYNLPIYGNSINRHAEAKRVLGSGNLDFVNSEDIRMAVGGKGRGLSSLGKRK